MINEDFLRREMNDIKASNGYTIGTLLLVLLPIGLSIVMQLMSQWNTGRTHPRKSKLPIIAEYLGVEVSDIQGDDTNKKEKPTAQGGELISDLPENIQKLISICLQNPDFTVLLLNLAQRMQNPPADPA